MISVYRPRDIEVEAIVIDEAQGRFVVTPLFPRGKGNGMVALVAVDTPGQPRRSWRMAYSQKTGVLQLLPMTNEATRIVRRHPTK